MKYTRAIDSTLFTERKAQLSKDKPRFDSPKKGRSNALTSLNEKSVVYQKITKSINKDQFKKATTEADEPVDSEKETSLFAILGLVFGVLLYVFLAMSILFFLPFAGILLLATLVLTFVFSILGLIETKDNQYRGRSMAIAGLVLGILSILLAIALLFLIIYSL